MNRAQSGRPARIAVDCRYIGPNPSGIGEMVSALVTHLPQLAPDCEFTLLRSSGLNRRLSDAPNVREITVRSPANGPVTLLHLPLAVNLQGIDLFHAPANILPGGLAMPAITTVHDVMWLTDPELCNPSAWGRVERAFYGHGLRRAIARSAAVATVSEASRTAIEALAPQAAGRVFVTRSGVAPDFRPVPPDPGLLARHGIAAGRRYVLVVGQGAPYKNHAGALRAFALACGGLEDVDLVVVQRRGRSGAEIGRLARELGLAGRVHVLPAIDRGALVQLYSGAAALLHPSFIEGFGNPLAEAMACGCPVVTSDRSAMPEVTGGAALLADPHDPGAVAVQLRKVIGDSVLASDLRERGLKRAAVLDWRAFAAANLALYRRVLAAGT